MDPASSISATEPLRVFVYGSLMRGGQYHCLMLECGGTFLSTGKLETPYPLIQADYPRLLDKPGEGDRVSGELYTLKDADSWITLDTLEGHPEEYCRRLETVECQSGNVQAWTYFYVLEESN